MMEAEMISETVGFHSQLIMLVAREEFIDDDHVQAGSRPELDQILTFCSYSGVVQPMPGFPFFLNLM
jgi:hypothetical protein